LNGLDPVGRRQVSNLLKELAAQGKSVVVSSHILHEVEQLTSQIILINRGRLLAQGDLYYIRTLIDQHPHRISIQSPEPRDLAVRLLQEPYVLSVRFDPQQSGRFELETREPNRFYAELPEIVLSGKFAVSAFDSPDNNLESVFRYLVKA